MRKEVQKEGRKIKEKKEKEDERKKKKKKENALDSGRV